jgi:hypothetical protein
MRSSDKGQTWEPVTPTLHKDVHQVATTPASDPHVYTNTYLSVYISEDQGKTWHHRSGALQQRYGRGIAINPEDPATLLCGISTFNISYMDEHTAWVADEDRLYLSQDRGQTWELFWTAPEVILTLSCHN